jgi:tRNA(Ile)-lysidine synthase
MLIHPLIDLWKSELLVYLESLQQPYRIDSTNLENGYTRNRIRNECLPYLERFSGQDQLKHRLRIASDLIRQEHEVIEGLASKWLDSGAVIFEEVGVRADFQELSELPWPVLQCGLVGIWHRMHWPLQQIGHEHWQRVRDWIDSARKSNHPKRMQLPGPVEMRIARRVLHLHKPD